MKGYKLVKQDMFKKRGSPKWVIALVVMVIITVVAFAIALYWHKEDISVSPPNTEDGIGEEGGLSNGETPIDGEDASEPTEGISLGDSGRSEDKKYPVREEYDYIVAETPEAVGNEYFDDVLFIGDSITTGIPNYLDTVFPDMKVVAERGVSLHNILEKEIIRMDNGSKQTVMGAAKNQRGVSKIYILVGGNDLGYAEKVFARDYRAFLQAVKEAFPDATIYVQSITPVTETKQQIKDYPYSNNAIINQYNHLIMEIARDEEVHYLDVATAFMGADGKLPKEASTDGVHFIGEYYYRWIDYLKKHTVGGK